MRSVKFSALLILFLRLTGDLAWANHCGLPGPDQVIIYQHRNRGDACAVLGIGKYPNSSHLGGVPNDSISAIDVGSNVRAVLYEHANFRGRQAHYEGGYYYAPLRKVDEETTSIQIFPMQGGAAATWYMGEYPKNSESFWAEDAQGLANDGTSWFATNTNTIFKVPLSYSLASSSNSGLIRTGIPPHLKNMGYNHFGDPDQNSGLLFVPLEKSDSRSKPLIAVFSTVDLRFLSTFELSDSPHRSAPWLAIHPGERTLWVSVSNLSDTNQLRVYDIDWNRLGATGQLMLTPRPDQVVLRDRDGETMNLQSMQGGVFNPEGTLLYTSNGSCSFDGSIHVFVIDDGTNTAQLQARSGNGYGPFNFANDARQVCIPFGDCACSGDEAEGLDWLDVRGLTVAEIPDGQLHLVMVENDLTEDDEVYVKHYSRTMAPNCLQGFVWREANQTDFVCVTGETRAQAHRDNSQAEARRNPNGGPFGPDTCLEGFVWREAFVGDHVCVTGETREQATEDNRLTDSRRQPLP